MSNDEEFDDEMYCNACQLDIRDHNERVIHYKTEWHRYNVKRRCAGLSFLTERVFLQKLSEIKAQAVAGASVQCTLCRATFRNDAAYQAHIATKKHLKNAQRRTAAEKKSSQGKRKSNASKSKSNASKTNSVATVATEDLPPPLPAVANISPAYDDDADDADLTIIPMDQDFELDPPIPLKSCLFCMKTFDTFEASVTHMEDKHGLFIPFAQYLEDKEGLFNFLGHKVGMGHTCLWCQKIKKSTEAVRSHMLALGHAKFDPDEDADILEFYNVPGEESDEDAEMEQDGKRVTGSATADGAAKTNDESTAMQTDEAVQKQEASTKQEGKETKARRRPVEFNEMGELVMSDGSIIGHRAFRYIYKQNLRPLEQRESVLLAQNAAAQGGYKVTRPDAKGNRTIIRVGGTSGMSVARWQQGQNAFGRKGYSDKALKTRRRLDKLRLRVGIQTNAQKFFWDYHSTLM
jgi:pre-60S factor REI1